MKASWITILALALCLSATGADKEKSRTFTGEIADSQCSLNVHSLTRSHEEMLKRKSMGGTSRNCTLYCIQYLGGDFVLSSKNDVLRLDDQDKAKEFAGMKVKIKGSMDPKTKILHVESMEAEP
ncbi:MAG TPA: hypothetical protein VH088_06160 [Terriglobales bacterium]|jgi:hypothetical protein|nr:hypothetical protein [Terriglobales bacterium]